MTISQVMAILLAISSIATAGVQTGQEVQDLQNSSKSAVVEITNEKPEEQRRVVLDVKNIQQLPELPAGCEITSTTMVLNYYGIKCDKELMVGYIPMMKYPDKNGRWESPWNVFVGDPHLNYYGAFSPVIKKTIESCFKNSKIKGYKVIDLTGSKPEELYKEIDAGNPVIVWATIQMKPVRKGRSWILQDGSTFVWPAGEHCLVLIGYDKDKDTVILSDPYDKRGTVEYPRATFEARYKELGSQALVIHKE